MNSRAFPYALWLRGLHRETIAKGALAAVGVAAAIGFGPMTAKRGVTRAIAFAFD